MWPVKLERGTSECSLPHSIRGKLTIRTAVPGDCGACVVDEIGNLYGHIVTGDSVSGLAYIILAYKILDDIEQRQGARPKLATTEEADEKELRMRKRKIRRPQMKLLNIPSQPPHRVHPHY